MTSFNTFPKWHNDTGGASGGQLRRAITQGHSDYISGRPILLLDRFSAGGLPLSRATSRECCAVARLSGLYHFNARSGLRRQALAQGSHHLKSLSCSASSSAERKARKAFHDGEKVSHESGQSSQERSHV